MTEAATIVIGLLQAKAACLNSCHLMIPSVYFRRKQKSLHVFIALLENTFSSIVEVKRNVLT